jgi:hypothetical protein
MKTLERRKPSTKGRDFRVGVRWPRKQGQAGHSPEKCQATCRSTGFHIPANAHSARAGALRLTEVSNVADMSSFTDTSRDSV